MDNINSIESIINILDIEKDSQLIELLFEKLNVLIESEKNKSPFISDKEMMNMFKGFSRTFNIIYDEVEDCDIDWYSDEWWEYEKRRRFVLNKIKNDESFNDFFLCKAMIIKIKNKLYTLNYKNRKRCYQ